MSIFDGIPDDPDPVVATIDFAEYVNGEKLSTLARSYFATHGPPLGAVDINDYFAKLLLIKLKETIAEENAATIAVEKANAQQAYATAQQAAINALEAVKTATDAATAEVEAIELVKK